MPYVESIPLGWGAQVSIDADAPDVMDQLHLALQDEQLGQSARGADLTYELSGNPAALDLAIAATGFGGRVIIGLVVWPQAGGDRFRRTLSIGVEFRLISSQVSTIAPESTGRWTKARRLQLAWRMLEHNTRLSNLVTHRFPFAQAAEAYALLDQQPQAALQILLTYDDC